jgi:uncharacterized protein (DUF2252 family)
MITMNVDVQIDEIIEGLCNNSQVDLIEFVLSIDEWVRCEGFTTDLIAKLVEAMVKEYSENSEYYARLAFSAHFTDKEEPKKLSPLHRSHSEQWEEADKLRTLYENLQSTITQIKQITGV